MRKHRRRAQVNVTLACRIDEFQYDSSCMMGRAVWTGHWLLPLKGQLRSNADLAWGLGQGTEAGPRRGSRVAAGARGVGNRRQGGHSVAHALQGSAHDLHMRVYVKFTRAVVYVRACALQRVEEHRRALCVCHRLVDLKKINCSGTKVQVFKHEDRS
jgi:hypothetical protein